MKKIAIITTILYFLNNSANADPSGLILKLMNTEVTMFSYGMDKLQSFVASNMKKNWIGGANYDWSSNQINIYMNKFGSECKNEADCLGEVKKYIADTSEFWCWTKEGSNQKCDLMDLVTDNFSTNGFLIKDFYEKKSSEEAVKDIKNFININAVLYKQGKKYSCTKKHIEKNIYCGVNSSE
jgi:hypothetical protein